MPHLTRAYRRRQPVIARGQRADPAGRVVARWVVGEIEVEHGLAVGGFTVIGALDRVEQVAAAAIGFGSRCRIEERQEDAAAVAADPIERQLSTEGRA